MIITASILEGLNEAGLIMLGKRQCAFVDPVFERRCRRIVNLPPGEDHADSIYSNCCYDCLIDEFGKGE